MRQSSNTREQRFYSPKPSFQGGAKRNFGQHGRGPRGGKRPSFGRRPVSKGIDPARLIKKATPVVHVEEKVTVTFADMPFHPGIQKSLEVKSFKTPTPIQAKTIPHILEGKDLMGFADTGTGKTLAFLLPTIHKTLNDRKQKTLIIAPTRELVNQIQVEFQRVAHQSMGLFSTVLIGGSSIGYQLRRLERNQHFIIATPGRLQDMIARGKVEPAGFTHVILDEVDRMLDMGFIEPIREILSSLDPSAQRLFFSATMDKNTQVLSRDFLREPVVVEISKNNSSDTVNQDVVYVHSRETKITSLQEIVSKKEVAKTLVFCNTKSEADYVVSHLVRGGIKAESIHGDKAQYVREKTLRRFREGQLDVLVGTDVAARGIDVKDVTHVINYDMPHSYEDYIHRIGRTGRAGSIGWAYTFVVR